MLGCMQPEKKQKISENETINKRNMEVKDNFVKFTGSGGEKYARNDKGPYFVITKSTKDNEKISDIKVGKVLHEISANGVIKVEKVNLYTTKITLKTAQDANNLITNEKLKTKEMKCYVPPNILTKKGVVSDIPTDILIEEIGQNIKSDTQIISVQRMTRRNKNFKFGDTETENNKKYIAANKVIVTFRAQILPENVSVFYTPRKVDIYRPRVKFCNKCQSYGHIDSEKFPCRNEKCCSICGVAHDEKETCEITCKFCKQQHRTNSRDCEKFRLEERAQIEEMYTNRMIQEVKRDLQQQMFTNNIYEILNTQQEYPELDETEDNENTRRFKSNFQKRDDRLTQRLRKTTTQRETYAKETQPSTSHNITKENEQENFQKRKLLTDRLKNATKRTRLNDFVDSMIKNNKNKSEESQNELAESLANFMKFREENQRQENEKKYKQNTAIENDSDIELEPTMEQNENETSKDVNVDDFLMEEI